MKKIGFIGCGNMGRAIIRGIIQGGVFEPDEIIVSDSAKEAVQSLKQCFKVTEAPDNQTLAAQAEIICCPFLYRVKVFNAFKDDY